MANATRTVDPDEARHFGKLAADWWNPNGSSAMLHRMNPVRLKYVREQVDHHFDTDEHDRLPLRGKRAADVGCGAGLLAEPLARLGAAVVGVDAAPENIAAARLHAAQQGLEIDYRSGSIDALDGGYDLVTCLEVVEHVTEPRAFVQGLADSLAPDGLLILSTPNRTARSQLMLIAVGEGLGRIPRGTHDWRKFLTPDELCALLREAGLEVIDVEGLAWSPLRGFHLSEDTSLDYFVSARPA